MEIATMKPEDYFLQKQMEIMIDMNNKKVAAELARMGEKITRLSDEMRDIRRQLSSGARRIENVSVPIVNADSGEVVNNAIPGSMPTASSPRSEQPLQQSSQRMGNYQSEDVSIDKFFYCGRR
ncbi:hypothetical protein JXA85_08935 [Candidatus Woesearchaeota archaeon]|nr:hypothetical protein [Candidatus Woesearchaeota archaeon]